MDRIDWHVQTGMFRTRPDFTIRRGIGEDMVRKAPAICEKGFDEWSQAVLINVRAGAS